jgi:hypothetical protein
MLFEPIMPIKWDRITAPTLVPLLEVCQTYCALSRNNACADVTAASYRSDALAESTQRVLPQSCHTPFSAGMAEAFCQYLAKKVAIIREHKVARKVETCVLDPLSLLLVRWRDSLFDGACTPLTHGYIDEDGIPGWDTWVAIVSLEREQDGHAMLCWVPPELCREVDSAVAIDAASSMSWLAFDRHSMRPFIVGWGQPWIPCERP